MHDSHYDKAILGFSEVYDKLIFRPLGYTCKLLKASIGDLLT